MILSAAAAAATAAAEEEEGLENLERSFFIFLRDTLCLFSMKCGRFRIQDKVSLL